MSDDSDSDDENFIRNVRLLDKGKPKSNRDSKDYIIAFVVLLIHSIFTLFLIYCCCFKIPFKIIIISLYTICQTTYRSALYFKAVTVSCYVIC